MRYLDSHFVFAYILNCSTLRNFQFSVWSSAMPKETEYIKKNLILKMRYSSVAAGLFCYSEITNNQSIIIPHRHSIAPNGSLLITGTRRSDTGVYTCTDTLSDDLTRRRLRLRVLGKLIFIIIITYENLCQT